MKTILACLSILIFTSRICDAQNLVPNGSFEQYYGCPNGFSQIDSAVSWMNPSVGGVTQPGSPDYYNQCASGISGVDVPSNIPGYQQPHSGVAYSGLYIRQATDEVREYLEVQLTSSLVADSCYHFEMYVTLADLCRYSSDAIGVYFSDTAILNVNNYYPLPFTPQITNTSGNILDTLNWKLIFGNYTAVGGETFLTIGNFKDDANTDTTVVNSTAPYTVVYCFVDDVSLTKTFSCNTGINDGYPDASVNIFPVLMTNELTVMTSHNLESEIVLYDVTSKKILQQKFSTSVTLNTGQLAKGIYLYEVRTKNEVVRKGKVVKN